MNIRIGLDWIGLGLVSKVELVDLYPTLEVYVDDHNCVRGRRIHVHPTFARGCSRD